MNLRSRQLDAKSEYRSFGFDSALIFTPSYTVIVSFHFQASGHARSADGTWAQSDPMVHSNFQLSYLRAIIYLNVSMMFSLFRIFPSVNYAAAFCQRETQGKGNRTRPWRVFDDW